MGYHEELFNVTAKKATKKLVVPRESFDNGTWTRPCFDCFAAKFGC